jgi:phosphonate transport system ATP-binding protein
MIEARGLEKRLPNGKVLLDQVSFKALPGEFVALLGASGAGKTLTIRSMVGLTSLTGGDVLLAMDSGESRSIAHASGRELRRLRSQVGVIFQGLQLVKRLSVIENVMIGRLGKIHPLRSWLYGFTDAEAEQAYAALERVGMESFAGRITGSLSGGEMQRVAIARAVHQQPLLYLADEPIASLDPRNSESVMGMLQGLAREKLVVGAFHQPEMVRRYCTRVIGLRGGKVVYDGSPALSQSQLFDIYGAEIVSLGHEVSAA